MTIADQAKKMTDFTDMETVILTLPSVTVNGVGRLLSIDFYPAPLRLFGRTIIAPIDIHRVKSKIPSPTRRIDYSCEHIYVYRSILTFLFLFP